MPDASEAPALRHVFVYGTLRAGGSNDINRLRPEPCFIGSATIMGTLYDLGPYPGLRLDGIDRVEGEIYAVTECVVRTLDALEEVRSDDSGEYVARTVDVALDGRILRCLLYEIHPSRILDRASIRGGDWLLHLEQRAFHDQAEAPTMRNSALLQRRKIS
ncbi:MAG: gamma-glutamylcyclotransferase [Comamonadaceae bacterium]|nr:MAG: gamma-glutamylcyclotransferase [Comamonadaceae bacterium]